MDKVSNSNSKINSLLRLIDMFAGLSFSAGLVFGSLYSVEIIKIKPELILGLIFVGMLIMLILVFKLKSESVLKGLIEYFSYTF